MREMGERVVLRCVVYFRAYLCPEPYGVQVLSSLLL